MPMRVISNTAVSLDGRINTRENTPLGLGSARDLQMMKSLRARVDAVLVGGATFRHWPFASLPDPDVLAARTAPFWNVVVTRSLDIRPNPSFFSAPGMRPLFLTTRHHTGADLPAEIEVFDGDHVPVPWILQVLQRRGVRTLMVEAGGDLLFQFLAADAIDELFVTLCPKVIGGRGAPSLADGVGFGPAQIRNLTLLDSQVHDDELYLHYRVRKLPVGG